MKDIIVVISEEEYHEHCEGYDGVCVACGDIQEGGVEPDAEEYKCEACGAQKVMGFEQALIMGLVDFE